MKNVKASVVITAIIVLAIVSSVVYVVLVPREKATLPDQMKSTNQADSNKTPPISKTGSYVDYSEGIIASTKGQKILFFHAAWCPQCRALETDIKAGSIPENTTIIKIDYDNSQALRQKYGVTIQTTVVRVDDEGNLVKKFVAYDDPTLDAVLEGLR